eukprot:CAMPEP_0171482812 /NCGR_PEP_ID=MMETSP0946-20130122/7733_1 /TAXON_ID=109269 /ORGANISM="Vaucheria litorea, Strain CCMP2940" /LENGTH=265 /DNA_ID=CAMNT_0012014985 /DNA_START=36 /DNA_END=830 /DNA_ORIENTATION=+
MSNDSTSIIKMAKDTNNNEKSSKKRGILAANAIPGLSEIRDEREKLRKDLSVRAEDIDIKNEAYKTVPIENFGLALLRGMGWKGPTEEDNNRFRNSVEVRAHKLGLGATPKPPQNDSSKEKKWILKPGQKADNKSEKIKEAWDKKVEKANRVTQASFSFGQKVRIISTNERAQIRQTQGVPGLGKVVVRFESNEKDATIAKTDIKSVVSDDESVEVKEQQKRQRVGESGWLALNIRVRVVGKAYKGGELHCKKGVVMNVSRGRRR